MVVVVLITRPGPAAPRPALIAIDALHADLGQALAYGLLVAIPTVIVAGPLYGIWIGRFVNPTPPARLVAAFGIRTAARAATPTPRPPQAPTPRPPQAPTPKPTPKPTRGPIRRPAPKPTRGPMRRPASESRSARRTGRTTRWSPARWVPSATTSTARRTSGRRPAPASC
ncbi:hypothetical protein [Dactylosporangium sp. NPDC000521]|uniref:GntT/GntP/DsdX family permease n=1 Tax=Dactylosporangium sp. NPDC000521 TaxID=3363975 RepID=UPI0036B67964